MLHRIHVDQHAIRANARDGGDRPVISVKNYKENRKVRSVEIQGPSRLVYSPDKPLPCGARVWIETEAAVCVE